MKSKAMKSVLATALYIFAASEPRMASNRLSNPCRRFHTSSGGGWFFSATKKGKSF